ncbi:MAG TPA: AsmA family protein [Methylibium sp.]|uniref:AsmA family protein n=1 Tax=Methylibium sp. TaxID=2067992 RepID=UPI002DB70D1E|nr:AsmA family protein [Methylibium sp.]HEU4458639.1 AsmA family protein [Methylibium sp.]
MRVTGIVVGVLVVALLIAWFVPWRLNFARDWIGDKVQAATGRELAIDGDIWWRFGFPAHLSVDGLRFANPEWASRPTMLAARHVEADIALLPLLRGQLVVPRAKAVEPDLWLEAAPDGRKNWLLDRKQSDDTASRKPVIGNVELDRGVVAYAEPAKDTEVRVELGTVQVDARRLAGEAPASAASAAAPAVPAAAAASPTPQGGAGSRLSLQASGRLNGLPLKATAHGDGVLQLQAALTEKRPYVFDLDASIGATRLTMAGSIAEPALPGPADLRIRASGPSLGQWYRITGIGMPDSPPYRTEGRVRHEGTRWSYEDFESVVGKSDLRGDIAFEPGPKRPRVSGSLFSNSLDLADFQPLLGKSDKAIAAAQKKDAKAAKAGKAKPVRGDDGQPVPRVLPQAGLSADKWDTLDADLRFSAKQVRNIGSFPIESVSFRLRMDDRRLDLEPLAVTLGGGKLEGGLRLDGRAQPMAAKLDLQVRRLALENLLPQIRDSRAALGRINGRVKLAGQGASYAAMLGSADGEAQFAMGQGQLSNLLLEVLDLDAYEALGFLVRGDRVAQVRCALVDVGFRSGVMNTRTLVFDTSDTIITVDGKVNFANEQLDLRIVPRAKDFSPLALRVPIDVDGAFGAPEVFPDKTRLALRGGAALALGLINPFAAILPLIETGPGEDADCAALTALARKEGVPVKSGAPESENKK